jgi:hypothetical protein
VCISVANLVILQLVSDGVSILFAEELDLPRRFSIINSKHARSRTIPDKIITQK